MIDPNKVHEVHEAALAEGKHHGKREALAELKWKILAHMPCTCDPQKLFSDTEVHGHFSSCPRGITFNACNTFHANLDIERKAKHLREPDCAAKKSADVEAPK